MKLLLTGIILFFFSFSKGQSWVMTKSDTTAFIVKDTLKRYSAQIGWDSSQWNEITPQLEWSKPSWYKRKYEQFRFGKTSGIRQRRVATIEYTLEPKKKTYYEIIIDSVTK